MPCKNLKRIAFFTVLIAAGQWIWQNGEYIDGSAWAGPAREAKMQGGATKGHDLRSARKMVVLGASYAGGWHPDTMTGFILVNKGIGGLQSTEMLSRIEKDVIAESPDAVVIWGFINDIFRSKREDIEATRDRTKRNIVEMVAFARQNGITPILATEVTIRGRSGAVESLAAWIGELRGRKSYQDYVNAHVMDINQWMREYARSNGILLLDFEQALSDGQGARKREYAQEDGSHISEAGYRKITQHATERLKGFFK